MCWWLAFSCSCSKELVSSSAFWISVYFTRARYENKSTSNDWHLRAFLPYLLSGYMVSPHVWEGRKSQHTQLTNVTLLSACNTSLRKQKIQGGCKAVQTLLLYPIWLFAKEKLGSWQQPTADVSTILLKEQQGLRGQAFHPSSQQDLSLTCSDLKTTTTLRFFSSLA